MDYKTFTKGQIIFSEGDSGDAAYLIQSGRVMVYKVKAAGIVPLGYRGQGNIFGEMALLDGENRMASAMADEDVVCAVINKEVIDGMVGNAPPALRKLMSSLLLTMRTCGNEIADLRRRVDLA